MPIRVPSSQGEEQSEQLTCPSAACACCRGWARAATQVVSPYRPAAECLNWLSKRWLSKRRCQPTRDYDFSCLRATGKRTLADKSRQSFQRAADERSTPLPEIFRFAP